MTRTRYPMILGGVVGISVILTGCGGQGNSTAVDPDQNTDAETVELTITSNAISGGKNTVEADWINDYVIPEFEAAQKDKGVDATVTFNPNGVDDEEYKTKISLDLSTGGGADIVSLDGIWFGEFAEAGYIAPLNDVVGADIAEEWEGWDQIAPAVQELTTYQDELYGIPDGTDGRILYFNKGLFAQAGLPTDWQPESWDDILEAGEALASLPGVTPLQINAGTAMGEATSMQGVLPLLVGTGNPIWMDDKWQGASDGLEQVFEFYSTVYGDDGLGDPLLQQEAQGRDKSFEMFAGNQLGMLIESDYLWRSVINPEVGTAPMANRDSAVGWAKIPAQSPGSGVDGQDFVSMSGGAGRVINPATKYPQQAFELLSFMASADAIKNRIGATPQVTARDDVNAEVLTTDPLLSFIADEVLPITRYRPSLSEYTQVSSALQDATASLVSGTSPADAAATYQSTLEGIVGGTDNVFD